MATKLKYDLSEWNVDGWAEEIVSKITDGLEERLVEVTREIATDIVQTFFDDGDPLVAVLHNEGVEIHDAMGNRAAFVKWESLESGIEGCFLCVEDDFIRLMVRRLAQECITHREYEVEHFREIVNEECDKLEADDEYLAERMRLRREEKSRE